MKRRMFIAGALASAFAATVAAQQGSGPGSGMGPGPGMGQGKGPGTGGMPRGEWVRERMYGSTLLTLEERQEHQKRMWNAKSTEERNQLRLEHRKLVDDRARARKAKVLQDQDDVFFLPNIAP